MAEHTPTACTLPIEHYCIACRQTTLVPTHEPRPACLYCWAYDEEVGPPTPQDCHHEVIAGCPACTEATGLRVMAAPHPESDPTYARERTN